MPASIVVVHDYPEQLDQMVSALKNAGHDVAAFRDPLQAIASLHQGKVLITRIEFGPGKPHGISLAQMAQTRRPGIKIVFTALPEYEAEAEELGEFLPLPVNLPELVRTVCRVLERDIRATSNVQR